MRSRSSGFTLIELLVVVAIIGLLSSVVLASLNNARAKAKDTRRVADLKQMQLALELYHSDNNAYPVAAWRSQCAAWGSVAADDVIPSLVPAHMPMFPTDPDMNAAANDCCYIYNSNGTDYKLLAHSCSKANYGSQPTFIDPRRDGGAANCTVDGSAIWSWAVYTAGAACW